MNGKSRKRMAAGPLLAAGLALCLAGCGDSVSQSLGLGKRAPDETAVIEQAPLELPPDFNLRPPVPGAPRPQDEEASDRAAAIVLGAATEPGAGPAPQGTPGERAFLDMAGANDADPGIRQLVNREAALFIPDDPDFVDELMFWQVETPEGTALDPVAEAERLRENEATGRGVTEGQTPVITRGERALLEGLNPF